MYWAIRGLSSSGPPKCQGVKIPVENGGDFPDGMRGCLSESIDAAKAGAMAHAWNTEIDPHVSGLGARKALRIVCGSVRGPPHRTRRKKSVRAIFCVRLWRGFRLSCKGMFNLSGKIVMSADLCGIAKECKLAFLRNYVAATTHATLIA